MVPPLRASVVLSLLLTGTALADVQRPAPEYMPNQVIVWFEPSVVALPTAAEGNVHIDEVSFSSPAVRSMLQEVGGTAMRMLTPTATKENLVASPAGRPPIQLDLGQLDMIVVSLADTNVAAALATLNADKANVRIAEPDWIKHPFVIPSDNLFYKQWWLRNTGQYNGVIGKDLNATDAWDRSTGGAPVGVVVLDGGSDPSHPDLSGRVVDGPNYSLVGVGDAPGASTLALSSRPNPSTASTTVEFSLPSRRRGSSPSTT